MKEYYLNSDNINEWVEKLEKGDRVYLSGTIYTARDAAHKKIVALLEENKPLPFELQNSIIYYENTYMQNSGIDYSSDKSFDVVSILEGTVIDVKNDNVMGTIVEIRHTNELISVYQSLSEVNVKIDDKVVQGQIIGKSGESNLNLGVDNNLHFELYYMGEIVNPEEYYDKSLTDL